jgi:hypothetical protein
MPSLILRSLLASLAAFAFTGLLHAAHADTLKSETEVRALADKVMAQAGAGRTDDAYGLLSLMRWWTSAPSRGAHQCTQRAHGHRSAGRQFGGLRIHPL